MADSDIFEELGEIDISVGIRVSARRICRVTVYFAGNSQTLSDKALESALFTSFLFSSGALQLNFRGVTLIVVELCGHVRRFTLSHEFKEVSASERVLGRTSQAKSG